MGGTRGRGAAGGMDGEVSLSQLTSTPLTCAVVRLPTAHTSSESVLHAASASVRLKLSANVSPPNGQPANGCSAWLSRWSSGFQAARPIHEPYAG